MLTKTNRRVSKKIFALAVCFILAGSTVSLGWGSGGHMMVAHIAFGRLNPNAKAKVQTLLAVPINPSAVTSTSPDFVSAAHWADDVKHLPGFEFSVDLHFIDIPFATDGTPLPTDLPKTENIVKALTHYVDVLKTSADQNEQAQALRFIIHFVGDIHQPLHCATKVDSKHPEGDLGGNKLMIKVRRSGTLHTVNLHSYWDGGIDKFPKEGPGPTFTPPPLSQIPPAAATATSANPDTDPDLNLSDPFNFQAWADESNKLAKTVAYKNVAAGKQPNAAYRTAAIKVARKRVAFAGYRLAALLNAIWP